MFQLAIFIDIHISIQNGHLHLTQDMTTLIQQLVNVKYYTNIW